MSDTRTIVIGGGYAGVHVAADTEYTWTWYGKLVGEKTMKQQKQPVDIAVDLNSPVLGLYGGKDDSIPQESVETMRQALRAANATAEIIVYPDAGHAFNADYRPSYHAESAQDGWQRMLAWFKQHGVAPKA